MKFVEKTYRKLDYREFDKAVNKHFKLGGKYESVPYEEWNNSSCQSFTVEPQELDKYDKEKLAKGDFHYLASSLFNQMCLDGAVEPGEYLINIFW